MRTDGRILEREWRFAFMGRTLLNKKKFDTIGDQSNNAKPRVPNRITSLKWSHCRNGNSFQYRTLKRVTSKQRRLGKAFFDAWGVDMYIRTYGIVMLKTLRYKRPHTRAYTDETELDRI